MGRAVAKAWVVLIPQISFLLCSFIGPNVWLHTDLCTKCEDSDLTCIIVCRLDACRCLIFVDPIMFLVIQIVALHPQQS